MNLLIKQKLTLLIILMPLFSVAKASMHICNAADTTYADTVYSKVDKYPNFPGGVEFLFQFIGNNIKYRDADVDDPKQRRVFVAFVAETDGSLSNIKAVRGTNDSLNREAVRVIAMSPKWAPGYKDGKAVRVSYAIPVGFGRGELHDSYSDEVYPEVTNNPDFPGGPDALNKFISQNIRYPKEDREKGLSGKVMVQFVVEKDGRLSGFKSISGPSETMKAEAIRVLSLSPKWHAGIWEGNKIVRSQYTVPVVFNLN